MKYVEDEMGLTCIYFHSVLVLGDTHLSLAHGIHPEGGGPPVSTALTFTSTHP